WAIGQSTRGRRRASTPLTATYLAVAAATVRSCHPRKTQRLMERSEPIDVDALQRENAALRAENERLRGLLGLGERANDARPPWTPTLFAESESEMAGGAVTS